MSISEYGNNSRRPKPPTASIAAPLGKADASVAPKASMASLSITAVSPACTAAAFPVAKNSLWIRCHSALVCNLSRLGGDTPGVAGPDVIPIFAPDFSIL